MLAPSWPSVRLALTSPALTAGLRTWLEHSGLPVTAGPDADVWVVDDAWLTQAGVLADVPAVVALGSPEWVRVLGEVAPGGWAALGTDAAPAELLAGVLAAAAGLAALPPEQVPAPAPDPGDPEALPLTDVVLTPRERDVLARLAAGLSNKRIARELGVTESTVKFHVQALYTKLGVQSRTGAVTRGIQLGLLSV